MKEIYILYYKDNGEIRSSGPIDRVWDADNLDGSTTTEYIESMLQKDSLLNVAYIDRGSKVPNSWKQKVDLKSKKVIDLTPADIASSEAIKSYSRLIKERTRDLAIEDLKRSGHIPADYDPKSKRKF